MRYEVPQFIEEETKIIGPLSVRQFLLYLGALGISFIFYLMFEPWLWMFLSLMLFGSITMLAFVKVHGRPLSTIFLRAASYFWNPRHYIWKKEAAKTEELFAKPTPRIQEEPQKSQQPEKEKQALTPEKIKELAKQLDKPKH